MLLPLIQPAYQLGYPPLSPRRRAALGVELHPGIRRVDLQGPAAPSLYPQREKSSRSQAVACTTPLPCMSLSRGDSLVPNKSSTNPCSRPHRLTKQRCKTRLGAHADLDHLHVGIVILLEHWPSVGLQQVWREVLIHHKIQAQNLKRPAQPGVSEEHGQQHGSSSQQHGSKRKKERMSARPVGAILRP